MRHTIFPIALIAIGAALLAEEMGWLPLIHSVWPVVIIVIGCAVLVSEGINRSSIVGGPLLIYIGAAWIAHDEGVTTWGVLQALGLIVLGVSLFIGHLPGIPEGRHRRSRRSSETPPPP